MQPRINKKPNNFNEEQTSGGCKFKTLNLAAFFFKLNDFLRCCLKEERRMSQRVLKRLFYFALYTLLCLNNYGLSFLRKLCYFKSNFERTSHQSN